MIGSLRGELVDHPAGGEVLVEVGGVGYRVTVAALTAAHLGGRGSAVFLWIHHHQRDDAQTLYGFASRVDRDCFELLLGAHGVGPALALAILSVHPPAELARALADDDLAALCLVPGVGRKTAARLAVELKSRLLDDDGGLALALRASAASGGRPAGASEGGGMPGRADDLAGVLGEVSVGASATNGSATGNGNGAGGESTDASATAPGNGAEPATGLTNGRTNGPAVARANGRANGRTNGRANGNGAPAGGQPVAIASPGPSPRTVVRQALTELGYGPDETRRALNGLDEDASLVDADESTLLRAALRQMGR